eukprot:TRINITY_DN715_c0_g1_i1.p1 TRINITY_DN715_c0_g1~~TRINITY_DN715_c0_g1_i1.p1  ORF type:complete len:146 (-),score=46.36 TRINITY_DN715_c0_g1_i1:43-480(-)
MGKLWCCRRTWVWSAANPPPDAMNGTVGPAGWSSPKPVGSPRNDNAHAHSQTNGGKGAPDKQHRKSRGKGRAGKDGHHGKDNASKNKDATSAKVEPNQQAHPKTGRGGKPKGKLSSCLLYTSDAADDLLCVDLGGRRIIKKKKYK